MEEMQVAKVLGK